MHRIVFFGRTFLSIIAGGLLFLAATGTDASSTTADIPDDMVPALHYFLDLVKMENGSAVDAQHISPLIAFLLSSKPADARYRADDSFDAPSAYHEFTVNTNLRHIIGYTMDADIPSSFFWPSSLRLARWTRVDGGDQQFARLLAAATDLKEPFILKGTEHITITPDQHTGAYYSYDVDKIVILCPYKKGKVMISIYRQQKPSAVGRKGWVLGTDDEWNYLYTRDKGLNLSGLGWVNTYMYDSFNITVYYEADPSLPSVSCGTFSWVKAGWAGINMVQPKHIHRGLVRVATAFKTIMESPRLPEPARLAETFAKSRDLPTPTLREYAKDYLAGLEQRIASSDTLRKKVGSAFNSQTLLSQMNRDELYAVLALDYFKKILGRNPVMDSHPF